MSASPEEVRRAMLGEGPDVPSTLKDLMRRCYEYGETRKPGTWEQWWQDVGQAMWVGHLPVSGMERMVTDIQEHLAALRSDSSGATKLIHKQMDDIHKLVTINSEALGVMIEAMQEIEPDEVIDKDGELWTLTAHRVDHEPDDDQLHYTVVCHGLEAATKAAAKAWGYGAWGTLRMRHARTED